MIKRRFAALLARGFENLMKLISARYPDLFATTVLQRVGELNLQENRHDRLFGELLNLVGDSDLSFSNLESFSEKILGQIAFGQEAEDLLLLRLIDDTSGGFYVDIGAHHPRKFSNTHLLHVRGWSGINVDATPGSMDAFAIERPGDCNLEIACAESIGVRKLSIFREPALNTFDPELSKLYSQLGHELIETRDCPTMTLESIFDKYVPEFVEIDVMSIDIEGLELEVLKTNNWLKFRPRFLVVEVLNENLETIIQNDLYNYLLSHGYVCLCKLVNSLILTDTRPKCVD